MDDDNISIAMRFFVGTNGLYRNSQQLHALASHPTLHMRPRPWQGNETMMMRMICDKATESCR